MKHLILMSLCAVALACQPDNVRKKDPAPNPGTQDAAPQKVPVKAAEPEPPAKPEPLPALSGEHHVAFDLLDNRPNAHIVGQDGAFVMNAGSPDAVRYIVGNHTNDWYPELEVEGSPALAIRGRKATMLLPSWAPEKATHLSVRVHNPNKQASEFRARLNGKKLPTTTLEPGWQTLHIELPEGAVQAENKLALDLVRVGKYGKKRSSGAFAWLRMGSKSEQAPWLEGTTSQGPAMLPASQGLAWHMWALPGSKLELGFESACALSVQTTAQMDGGAIKAHEPKVITPVEGIEGVQNTFVSLSDIAGDRGRLVRMTLTADSKCSAPLALKRARLMLKGARPEVPKFEPPKHIVLWKSDALRADYLPFYAPHREVHTPVMSKLVDEGVVFDLGWVEGNESKVSHASMFTGQYPKRHGIHPAGGLKKRHYLLSEAFKGAKWRTGAHASNGYIAKHWGYDQGWNWFSNALHEKISYTGNAMVSRSLSWMKKHKDHPFFFYLGTIDVHVRYRRHNDIIQRYYPEKYGGRFKKAITGLNFRDIWSGDLKLTKDEKAYVKALYKNEITYNDRALGKLIEGLKELGIWESTMIVITSDHGDELFERGKVGHGQSLYQELVHVPLVMYYPKLIPAGTRVRSGADVLDIFPTLLDIIGQKRPEGLQGRSLVPLIFKQSGDYPEPVIATDELHSYAMQISDFKMYFRKDDTFRVYDRSVDQPEFKDVHKSYPMASRWLLDSLGWFRAHRERWDKSTWGMPNNLAPDFLEKRVQK